MRSETSLFRELPSVDELLRRPEIAGLIDSDGRNAVADACRVVLLRLREQISVGHVGQAQLTHAISGIPDAVSGELRRSLAHSLKPVINATGVILHTNLGRAPLSAKALDHIRETAAGYSNLEFDLDSGERGKRDIHVDRLFQKLLSDEVGNPYPNERAEPHPALRTSEDGRTGVLARAAVSTIVVNNNAAAVLLALNTLAEGGEVIVSRGELVEIGGSFRIPEVMAKSGAILREVGTTNRTRVTDYERAINERTKLLLRVHRSNFEISGFTEQPPLSELAALAQKHKVPLLEDLGSGALFDLRSLGIDNEPGVLQSLRTGVHVVTYSGDKLLGGPQAGLISGRADLVQKMRGNSLFRALRVDKLTYAALEATLLAYVRRDYNSIPALSMMHAREDEIRSRAEVVTSSLSAQTVKAELLKGESLIGGGSAPSAKLPATLIAITHQKLSAEELARQLRACDPPVIARIEEGRVLLDLRTVFPAQDHQLVDALAKL
jgi:L-seryl-tRNA(Ser) seleniumtransferase